MSRGKTRFQRDSSVVACERLLVAIQVAERVCPIIVRLGELWLQLDGAVTACERLFVPLQLGQTFPRLLYATAKSDFSAIAMS